MSGPDFDHGYLRLPLAVWREVYCQAPLTRRQLQIVSVILRESWGWTKRGGTVWLWTRLLTPRQLAGLTSLSTDHLARDLRALLSRGVLRERAGRYQFVPEVGLWKSPETRAPKERPGAPKSPAATAKTALRPLASKKGKISNKNVVISPQSELSPTVDNSSARVPVFLGKAEIGKIVDRARSTETLTDRLARLIEAFVGPIPTAEAEALRAWIRSAGMVPVWDSLEQSFRQGRRATREYLHSVLTDPLGPPMNDKRRPDPKVR